MMKLMRSEKISIAAIALAATALTYLSISYLGYVNEGKRQQTELKELTVRVFEHSQSVLMELDGAFVTLANLPTTNCSGTTLNRLRAIVKSGKYIKSASVEIGQNTYCSDVGKVFREKPKPDYRTADGTMVWLRRKTMFGSAVDTLYLQRGNIILSTLHFHLLNVISSPSTSIVMFSTKQKQIMAMYPDNAQVDEMVMAKLAGRNANLAQRGEIYVALFDPKRNVSVVAFRPISTFAQVARNDLQRWLPISLIFGLLAALAAGRQFELRHTLENKLQRAIRRKNVHVHYQPIVTLADGRCIGAECLVRWCDAEGIMVPPDWFIPIAEETGLIEPLTDLILEKAIDDLADLLQNNTLYLSINLSASDMGKLRFYPILHAQLEKAGLPAGRIAIEATERGFINTERANEVIAQMRDAGHAIFIDDFGTGYSSLSYLQKLAIDVIKIDKSFVDAIDTGSATSSVIVHIIAMAKQLNLKTVAEGVETQAQADFLHSHGVDAGQGWLFSKPLPADEFRTYLKYNHGHTKTYAT